MNQKIILLIEDDEALNKGISFALKREGYLILSSKNLTEGAHLLKNNTIDLLLLDLNLPDGDGVDFCASIQKEYNFPIIMLTARDTELDEILGLESGAYDYVTKPFSLAILKARIHTIFRIRETLNQTETQFFLSNEIHLDKKHMKVWKKDIELELSITEFKLLLLFLENKNQVLLKEYILDVIWDSQGNFVDENTLPVNIRRLRLKLETDPSNPRYLKTIHGMGYIWNEN